MSARNSKSASPVTRNFTEDGLLTPDDVASLLQVDLRTLANWRYKGVGPVFTKLGGIVRYTRTDVNDFVASSRHSMTGHALAA